MKRKKNSKKENDSLCETSNIKFGKLDIVLQSNNSVPDIKSFYDTVAGINNSNTTPIIIQNGNTTTINNNNNTNTTNDNIFPCSFSRPFNNSTIKNPSTDQEREIYCWWCRITSINISQICFLPTDYNEKKKIYTKHGYFCCWECAKSFNFDIRDIKAGFRSYLINQICRNNYGIEEARSIKYARHWIELKRFGGTLNDDEFFKNKKCTTLALRSIQRDSI